MRHPAREEHHHAALRPGQRAVHRRARRRGGRLGVAQQRADAARIEELELAAQVGRRRDAAVVDVEGPGPEAARMGVQLVGLAAAIDVGPALDAPVDGDRPALPVDGQAVGEGPGPPQHGVERRAAPAGHVAGRVPAADVAVRQAAVARRLAGQDHPPQLGREALALGQARHEGRRRMHGQEAGPGERRVAHRADFGFGHDASPSSCDIQATAGSMLNARRPGNARRPAQARLL